MKVSSSEKQRMRPEEQPVTWGCLEAEAAGPCCFCHRPMVLDSVSDALTLFTREVVCLTCCEERDREVATIVSMVRALETAKSQLTTQEVEPYEEPECAICGAKVCSAFCLYARESAECYCLECEFDFADTEAFRLVEMQRRIEERDIEWLWARGGRWAGRP